jgi:hypothetical protein
MNCSTSRQIQHCYPAYSSNHVPNEPKLCYNGRTGFGQSFKVLVSLLQWKKLVGYCHCIKKEWQAPNLRAFP